MSERKAKQIRRIARLRYAFYVRAWQSREPKKRRIFRYLKWKKSKPTYEDIEKRIKFEAKEGLWRWQK